MSWGHHSGRFLSIPFQNLENIAGFNIYKYIYMYKPVNNQKNDKNIKNIKQNVMHVAASTTHNFSCWERYRNSILQSNHMYVFRFKWILLDNFKKW